MQRRLTNSYFTTMAAARVVPAAEIPPPVAERATEVVRAVDAILQQLCMGRMIVLKYGHSVAIVTTFCRRLVLAVASSRRTTLSVLGL